MPSIPQELRATEDALRQMLEGSGWKVYGPGTAQAWGGYGHRIVMVPNNHAEIIERHGQVGARTASCGGVSVYWRRNVHLIQPALGPCAESTEYGKFTGRGWRQTLVRVAHAACTEFARQHGSTPPASLSS